MRQKEPRRYWDYLKLKLPVFGSLFQRIYIVRFTRSMATLIEGGVPITASLNIVSDIVGNAFYKDLIDRTAKDVQDGNPIATLFLKTKEMPPMIAPKNNIARMPPAIPIAATIVSEAPSG